EAFVALRQLDPQRRRQRAVEAEAEPEVALHAMQIQIASRGRDLADVVEERHLEEPVGVRAPLALQEQAVQVAEAPARIRAQIGAAAEGRHHEERNLLAAL